MVREEKSHHRDPSRRRVGIEGGLVAVLTLIILGIHLNAGFLCFDNARLNYWDGYRFPYHNGKILVGGLVVVHPCLLKPINL